MAIAAVVATPSVADAAASTFTGSSTSSCTKPPAPVLGTSTGGGSCTVTAYDSFCLTGVDAGEVTVGANCSADLFASTTLTYLQFRREQGGPVEVHCFGAGAGTLKYRPTPSSPIIDIAVTITVTDGYATFSGVNVAGIRATAAEGVFTGACGGSGSYGGEVL